MTYDNLDRLTQITDANGGMTKLAYDADGDLTSLTDANNNSTNYPTYDSRDRLTKRTDALGKSESCVYDADSNVTQCTDRNGAIDVLTNDLLNRRTFAGFGKTVKGKNTTYSAGRSLAPGTEATG